MVAEIMQDFDYIRGRLQRELQTLSGGRTVILSTLARMLDKDPDPKTSKVDEGVVLGAGAGTC